MIRLNATDFFTLYRPSRCENRVYLKQIGQKEAQSGPFEQVLYRLGERHETSHLNQFPEFIDLQSGTLEERARRTKEEVQKGSPVVYQGILRSQCRLGDMECDIIGEPDFLIRNKNNYIIRDSKISLRITEKDHPEILRQLEIYGWLYEQTFGQPPAGLQVHSGTGDIVEIPYDGGLTALQTIQEISTLKLAPNEPYSPVGWSKCGGCLFHEYCWSRAEKDRDVALV
jgi:predicted RecB family nuclease